MLSSQSQPTFPFPKKQNGVEEKQMYQSTSHIALFCETLLLNYKCTCVLDGM